MLTSDAGGNASWQAPAALNTGFVAQDCAQNVVDETATNLIFPTVINDDGSNYNATTGVYTAPAAGFYHFSASGFMYATPTNDAEVDFSLLVNGSAAVAVVYASNSAAPFGLTLSTEVKLAAGDKVQVEVESFAGDASTTVFGAGNLGTTFSGYRIY